MGLLDLFPFPPEDTGELVIPLGQFGGCRERMARPSAMESRIDPRFHEIPRERVADRVAQELLRLIASGELAPGERLPGERQLAEMMNVSRVSVRAALQQLKAQGLVAAVQGGGTRVIAASKGGGSALAELIRVNRDNLHDLAEIRASIEVWAARRAAERGTPEQIAEIGRIYDLMTQPDRAARYKAEDDLNFHMTIAKASASGVYLHLMSVLSEILEDMFTYHRYRLQIGRQYDRLLLAQHGAIYDAIRRGDGEGAARAMAEHLDTVLSSYAEDETPAPPNAGGKIRVVSG